MGAISSRHIKVTETDLGGTKMPRYIAAIKQ